MELVEKRTYLKPKQRYNCSVFGFLSAVVGTLLWWLEGERMREAGNKINHGSCDC